MFKLLFFAGMIAVCSCQDSKPTQASLTGSANTEGYQDDSLPVPFATKSAKNFSKVVGWEDGKTPVVPQGFMVSKFAEGLDHPRWIYVADNGDVFVAEANTESSGLKKVGEKISGKSQSKSSGTSANVILMFRDADKNGVAESQSVFLDGLNQPFGMLIMNNKFYVANTDGVYTYPYTTGANSISSPPQKILNLPAGGYNNHWTRNLLPGKDKSKVYVSVGSGSNVAEHGLENEIRRANILEINPDGSGEKVYASGLRNPVGMDWASDGVLWTAVNERDGLGDELVPDYITGVQRDGFYGWPFSYWGNNPDPRMKDDPKPEMVSKAIVPDVPLGSHTASLGIKFYKGNKFPEKYRNGAFVTQHGSWNRSTLAGYKVVFVPFKNGKPSGKPEDFLTGFIKNLSGSEVYGRPVGIAELNDGSMLIADDASNVIWRISYNK